MRKKQNRQRGRKQDRKVWDAIFILGFLGVIGAPLLLSLLPAYRIHASRDDTVAPLAPQGRAAKLLPRQVLPVAQAARDFLHNFKSGFALRDTLVRCNAIARVRWLHNSSSTDVVLGKNDWLFYARNASIEDFRRLSPWTPQQLDARRAWFQALHRQAEKCGAKFLLVVAPDKHSIYPEAMPDNLAPLAGPSHLDQLLAALQNSDVAVLDLRPALLHAKAARDVYSRTDTHWNAFGAIVAYQACAARLKTWFPTVRPIAPQEIEMQARAPEGGDLARLLGLQNDMKERRFDVAFKAPRSFGRESVVLSHDDASSFLRVFTMEQPRGEIARAVVFGDSFVGTPWRALLAQHFRRSVWVHRREKKFGCDDALLRRERPNIVIYEIVERALSEVAS